MSDTRIRAGETRMLPRNAARPQLVRRAKDEDDDTSSETHGFHGHAAVFDQEVLIGMLPWGFYERFNADSFDETLADAGESLGIDQAMLIDHNSFYVVARRGAETLELSTDDVGLVADVEKLDERLSYVRDLVINLDNGNITGMSIGFYVDEDEWSTREIDSEAGKIKVEVRTIKKASLLEVSAVTFPAFPQTDAGLRQVADALVARGDTDAIEEHAEAAPALRSLTRGRVPTRPHVASRSSLIDLDARALRLAPR